MSTQKTRTIFILSAAVSSSIPMMLDGIGIPVSHTINSPNAKKENSTAHCSIIISDMFQYE